MKQNNKSNKKRLNKRSNRVVPGDTELTQILNPSDIMPPHITRRLNYVDGTMSRTSASSFLIYRFRANSIFDPDPLLLTGAIAGFGELAQLYREYKVTHCEFEWNVVNQETFPVVVGVTYSPYDIAASISTAPKALDTLENGFSTRGKILSAKGGMDRFCFKGKMALATLLGNQLQYEGDHQYASLVTGNPTNVLFINFFVVSTTGAALTNGIVQGLTLRFTTKLFNRQSNLDI